MKTREEEEERTKTRVSKLPSIDFDSSLTIWQEETQSLTTAKSANTSQNGVNIEKNGKLRNRGLELLLQRKWYPETDHNLSYRTQQYGWRAPIDDFSHHGKNRVAICKKTFFDPGHL